MSYYEDVFLNVLQVPKEFLTEHADIIQAKLRCAAADFVREHAHFFAINQCVHLATSIIFSYPDNLNKALEALRNEPTLRQQGQDPTTVLTVITLYYLLESELRRVSAEERARKLPDKPAGGTKSEDYENELNLLRDRFEKVNWLVGRDAMTTLGFES